MRFLLLHVRLPEGGEPQEAESACECAEPWEASVRRGDRLRPCPLTAAELSLIAVIDRDAAGLGPSTGRQKGELREGRCFRAWESDRFKAAPTPLMLPWRPPLRLLSSQ